jgi:hypothetical protein
MRLSIEHACIAITFHLSERFYHCLLDHLDNQKYGAIFDNAQISISTWKRQFKDELGLVCAKAKPTKEIHLSCWRDSYT